MKKKSTRHLEHCQLKKKDHVQHLYLQDQPYVTYIYTCILVLSKFVDLLSANVLNMFT